VLKYQLIATRTTRKKHCWRTADTDRQNDKLTDRHVDWQQTHEPM